MQAAPLSRDILELMADPLVVACWGSEERSASPSDIVADLGEACLAADTTALTFTASRDSFLQLNGMNTDPMFGPELDVALVIFSEGWGWNNRSVFFEWTQKED
jgi:hypothetical protein